jgi:hypothetical protein
MMAPQCSTPHNASRPQRKRRADRRPLQKLLAEARSIMQGDCSNQFHWCKWGYEPIPVPKAERPVCGARCREGHLCQARAVVGRSRCRLQGGLSTGAKTAEGRQRIAESNWRRAKRAC